MKVIIKKVGKKAVLADVPDDIKTPKALAEYCGGTELSAMILEEDSDTYALFETAALTPADGAKSTVTIRGKKIYGDVMLTGRGGRWLRPVNTELYTNRALLPWLWVARR